LKNGREVYQSALQATANSHLAQRRKDANKSRFFEPVSLGLFCFASLRETL